MIWNTAKADRGTGTMDLCDDKNGGSVDGRQKHCAVDQKDTSTDKTDNGGLDVNDGEKEMEEERHNEGNSGYAFGEALPDMNVRGNGMVAQRGRTGEELALMVGNTMTFLETWKKH